MDAKYYKIAPKALEFIRDADVVHVHGLGFFSDFLAATKWLHGKPLVLNTHGGVFHTESARLWKKIYFWGWQKLALRAFDAIVADSESDKALFEQISDRVTLIEDAVDLSLCKSGKKIPRSLLYVGRISKNKRLDRLLLALHELQKMDERFSLTVVGEDWEGIRPSLEARCRKLGLHPSVRFVGSVSESALRGWYAKSAFFVSASEYEGFGLALPEAMGSGCVPIVNRIPSFESMVSHGVNGWVVDFADAKKSAMALKRALSLSESERKRYSDRALKDSKRWDWKRAVPQWEKLYQSVIR